ncbi:MAG: MerR family transcriptional regulator [Dorea sp.]|jgi:DNA-binding transcriptional MerR regulator|nr:MerR family transcriptional regulator [Dorea sp.]
MKNYYKISEISKLYGIGPDSLRYYERLGILKPKRDTNQYRLYSLKDIYKLNLICDLRKLNFSMSQIKEYLDCQTINNTLDILRREQSLLKIQLQELIEKEKVIGERIDALRTAKNIIPGQITIKTFPRRLCVMEKACITQDEEMDLLIQKLLGRHEKQIHNFGNQTIGAFLSSEDLMKGISNVYKSVFFILDKETLEYDYELPAGDYLSYYYRGNYNNNCIYLKKMMDHIARQNFTVSGEPFELYEIDNRDTMEEEEFLTEIQIRITS